MKLQVIARTIDKRLWESSIYEAKDKSLSRNEMIQKLIESYPGMSKDVNFSMIQETDEILPNYSTR